MRSDLATFLDDFRRHGDASAIVAHRGNRRVVSTWNQIAHLADRFAAELMRRDIPMGERVVICGQNGLEWMGAFFGCVQYRLQFCAVAHGDIRRCRRGGSHQRCDQRPDEHGKREIPRPQGATQMCLPGVRHD